MISPAIAYTRIKMSIAGKALIGLGLGGAGLAAAAAYGASKKKKVPVLASTNVNVAEQMANEGTEENNRRFVTRTGPDGRPMRVPAS